MYNIFLTIGYQLTKQYVIYLSSMKNIFLLLTFSSLASILQVELLFSENSAAIAEKTSQKRNITKAKVAPAIDGKNEDECWDTLEWSSLDQRWLGEEYDIKDFSGRYKLTWDEEALYLLPLHIM